MGNARAVAKRTSAKTFMSFNISVSLPGVLNVLCVGQEQRICPSANCYYSSGSWKPAGNPVFVRAGRNEVGGACFIATRHDCEISEKCRQKIRASQNTITQDQNVWASTNCREQNVGGNNEVRGIYYETVPVS